MSLARHIPFDPATDVLLRYGQVRQDCDQKREVFLSGQPVPALSLPALLKPPVQQRVQQQAGSWAASQQALLPLQRTSPLLNQLACELYCGTWLRTLETVTGESNLLPDPYVTQGGLLRGSAAPPVALQHPLWRLPAALVLEVLLDDPQQQGVQYGFGDGNAQQYTLPAGAALVWQLRRADALPCRTAAAGALALRVVYWQDRVAAEPAA